METYDAVVVGAGSGGVAFAKRAASHSAKVAIVENAGFGGTCVNVGCVPKKIMWWSSQVHSMVHEAKNYGIQTGDVNLDFAHLKRARDRNIKRLNGIYEKQLQDSKVDIYRGTASFAPFEGADDDHPRVTDGYWCIQIDDSKTKRLIRALHVVVATGSKSMKLGVKGEDEVAVGSDGFFQLETLPKTVAVIGAGYIAVEFAGMLQELGASVDLFIRYKKVLRKFDDIISSTITEALEKQGVTMHRETQPTAFEENKEGKWVVCDKQRFGPFEAVIVAVGREPNTAGLNLESAIPEIKVSEKGAIQVDEYQNTSAHHVYSIGDVISKVELTPVAIAAGRKLADRLFMKGAENFKISYENVPSVIFSHPPVGSVGISEAECREKYEEVVVYNNTSVNLYYNVFDCAPESKPRTWIKLVCSVDKEGDEIIRGIHMVGMGADEAIQGFGLAVGQSKEKLDSVIAVHPSAAEEIVTCQPWGLPHPDNSIKRPLKLVLEDLPTKASAED